MKIVISTDVYYPMINGVAVFSRNLAAGLKKRGHQVMVLAPSLTGKFGVEKDKEFGYTVVRLKSKRMYLYPDQIEKVPKEKKMLGVKVPQFVYKNGLHVSYNPYSDIKRVLDDFQPDIIHDQTPGPLALAVFRYAKKRNIPIVSTDHAYPDNLTQQVKLPELAKKPINAAMNAYFLSFLRRSEYATMPTEQAITDLLPKRRHSFKVPIEAISNGIDLSRFAKGRANADIYEKYNIPRNIPIVLYVGRVDPEKSLDVLMHAFVDVLQKVPKAHLVVVGDGTARQKLEKIAAKEGIVNHAHFLGRIIGDDLPQVYRTGTVFAITSKTETQSIVIMEAMASGLPVVTVKAGAVPELVKHGKNGYIYDPDDKDGVARGIAHILANKDLCEKMSDDAVKRIAKHDISYTLTRIEEIYNIVLDKRAE
ncbi:MAG: glycosyltransferase [Candidatus Saccharibacteria bacterium]|nr:glycosyltransferase [Candidatus Saccharibacteria bacterium]